MPKPELRVVGEPHAQVSDLSDEDLLTLVRLGRHDAFEALARRYQRLVLGLATRFLGDDAAGRDVAQHVFLSLWAERDRPQRGSRLASYLVSVTLNRCRYVARQARTADRKAPEVGQRAATDANANEQPIALLLELEHARRVRRALAKVPEVPRHVLVLRFTNELSLSEISDTTGMPVGTVKSHLFRGLKRLQELLEKDRP